MCPVDSTDPWEGWSWEESAEDSFSEEVELSLQNMKIKEVVNSCLKMENSENKT